MAFLLDSNILVRFANTVDVQRAVADRAVLRLHRQGETLNITPQNLIEFRNVATRPTAANGLGQTPDEAEFTTADFERMFPLLVDTPGIFPAWKAIVTSLGIIGKQVHDARLVAVCHAHQVSHLLTFNGSDFNRLALFGPGVVIVDPLTI